MSGALIWVTRTQPGARATAHRLRAMGFDPLVAPLLEVRALGSDPIDLAGVGALAFTSANGVAAFAARSGERSLPVFAVGAATTAAASAAGFGSVTSADGDVAALAPAVAAGAPFAGEVLTPGPVEPAGDLVGALAALGVAARAMAVYETVSRAPDPPTSALIPGLAAVLLHSPRAARVLADHLADHPAPRLTALCLSEAVAAPLTTSGLASVRAARQPTEAALLALLSDAGAAAR
ncbi:MAG: uroporphyrinogen-III synthase [Caulobacteraceae bacterium]|nr:uroporphyrinogen-III synthase [Caulobacteraceae bacterium]